MPETPDKQTGHEVRDVNAGGIGCFAIVLVVGAVGVFLFVAWMFHHFDAHFPGGAANRITTERISAPEPKLQGDPASDLTRFRAHEDKTLTSYGWVDRAAGIVRIPIERAMELIAERGLPATQATGKTPLEMRQDKAKEGAR